MFTFEMAFRFTEPTRRLFHCSSYLSQYWNLLCPECKSEALQLDQITVMFEELLRAVLLVGVVCKLKVSFRPYVYKAPAIEPTSLYTKEPLCCEDISQQSTCSSSLPPEPRLPQFAMK